MIATQCKHFVLAHFASLEAVRRELFCETVIRDHADANDGTVCQIDRINAELPIWPTIPLPTRDQNSAKRK